MWYIKSTIFLFYAGRVFTFFNSEYIVREDLLKMCQTWKVVVSCDAIEHNSRKLPRTRDDDVINLNLNWTWP
jgi:hypothetical protein